MRRFLQIWCCYLQIGPRGRATSPLPAWTEKLTWRSVFSVRKQRLLNKHVTHLLKRKLLLSISKRFLCTEGLWSIFWLVLSNWPSTKLCCHFYLPELETNVQQEAITLSVLPQEMPSNIWISHALILSIYSRQKGFQYVRKVYPKCVVEKL